MDWASDFLGRYKDANTSRPSPFCSNVPLPGASATGVPSVGWIALPPGCVKLNVDAGVATELCRIGCGAVIRDHLGTCLASAAVPIAGLLTPPSG